MATSVAPTRSKLLPFRLGTVRRVQPIGVFPVTPGQPIPSIEIPQVGMLARVLCSLEGTVTQSAAGSVSPFGYASLLSRVTLRTNQGSASIVDASGLGLDVINQSLAPQTLPIAKTYANGAAANPVAYRFVVPVNANQRRNFEMGLINLQAPQIRVNLDISFAPIANFVTNVTATSLQLFVAYEYYEIPDPTKYALPPLTLVRTLEDSTIPVVATGDQTYQIPRLGTMIDYHAIVVNNADYVDLLTDVDKFRIRFNKTDTQYDIDSRFQELREAATYQENGATFMRNGVISLPLFAAGDRQINGGDFRDAIDTEENTTTESIITINSGVVLTNASISHVRRVVQRILGA